MEQKTTDNPSSKSSKGIWYVLAVVLLLLFIFGLASNKKKPESMNPQPTMGVPSTARTQTGSYAFSAQTATASSVMATTGVTKMVPVTMDSQGHQVVGYTLILQYDPTTTKVGKIASANPDFLVSQSEFNKGYIVVDGIKDTKQNAPIMFNKSPLLQVPVTTTAAGTYSLHLVEKHNKDEVKFFDENVAPYYPVGGVVTIESK